MFRPEKMSFINISVLDTNITQVLDCVVRLGIMHIVDKKDLPSTSGLLKDLDIQPTKDKLYDLNNRLNLILDNLEIDTQYLSPIDNKNQSQIEINPFQILDKAQKSIENIESEVMPIVHQMEQLQAKMKESERDSEAIHILETQSVNLQDLRNTRFLYIAFGEIPAGYDHYRRLSESLERINVIVLLNETVGNKRRIMAFGLMSDEDIITNALEGAYFTKIDIPEKYQGAIQEILDNIELEIWTIREEIAELKLKIRSLRKEWRKELLKLHATIFANQTIVESMERFGRTERTYFLSGWVPYKEVKKLKMELEKMDAHGVLMNATEPIKIHEADDYRPKVPTKLVHPFFLKPFSGLTMTFDVPRYSAIDPTFFVALSFLAMFGIMFADVGHGSVFLLLGLIGALLPFPAIKPLRKMLAFLSCCGGASIITGLLFGNLFGNETIIKPLWFSLEHMRASQVTRMLSIGIYFGIGMITLGVCLSIIQSFMKRNYKEAFFGQWGLSGLGAYWIVVYMLITKSPFSWDKVLIIILLMFPIMLKQPISRIFKKKENGHQEHAEEEHGESIIELSFQIYEVALAYLANTVSYIRIAAFNLSHAGLMMAAYMLTKQLGGDESPFLSIPSNVMSNVFVIMLEGLIVGIQCIRLEYYEFFSKFFAGEGIEYKPLKIS